MVNMIISNITHNDKRMSKLRAIKKGTDIRDKAAAFVIGEAAALKVRLTDDEIRAAAVRIVSKV